MLKFFKKSAGLAKKTNIFHQDNARVHTSALTMVKLNEIKYELLEHPPYSPDLAPSDYYLFRNLKQFVRGKRFSSNEEVISTVEQYFAELPENYDRNGIKLLEDHQKLFHLKIDILSFLLSKLFNQPVYKVLQQILQSTTLNHTVTINSGLIY